MPRGNPEQSGPSVPTAPSELPGERFTPLVPQPSGPQPRRAPRSVARPAPVVPQPGAGPAERRLRVLAVVGTRPEVIKLSRVLAALDRAVDLRLVHTGQNYDHELSQVFFDELGVRRPDHTLECAGATPAETISRLIGQLDPILAAEQPDALLIHGDTNTCYAAIAAKRRRIAVFHLEAGNRCFDQRVPEEINRRVADQLSDVHLALTEQARGHLLAEGLPTHRIFVVGSPVREVLDHYAPLIDSSSVLATLGVQAGRYLVVSVHREENVSRPEAIEAFLDTLNRLAVRYRLPVVVSTHPRTRDRLAALRRSGRAPMIDDRVRFCRPFGFPDYIALQRAALCVLSDSATLTEESSLVGFPAVLIREAHERPEGMDRGVLVSTVLRADRVLAAAELIVREAESDRRPRVVADYAADDVSRRVVHIIVSYVDHVRRTVWFGDAHPDTGPHPVAPATTAENH
ncbi:non-hydrolyzing UDP-N-acetylglucosamine 2-epimerase [Frankia sp. AgKG'84/4]|uniref:non-hydrolyzing UDP-N-acetylglucosamine 2-epimerase n=1 Tax=Frankia sp. AgKG'84/4 TaxID=573490 RepID=UPI00200CDC7C|nr:UDP-N-acetylglucosamine 2-epimerase (non-hydrolyzing) [Frankia sp. AgKG'84/4]MCL9795840.1 UDP-N-acetylglucosamine 2-epimerase (non-hydrolyzing) [Frankia sp. AgKG'84/4]